MGSVIGSAAIAALMTQRISAHLGGAASPAAMHTGAGPVPELIAAAFAKALAESLLLPALVLLIGWVAVLLVRGPPASVPAGRDGLSRAAGDGLSWANCLSWANANASARGGADALWW